MGTIYVDTGGATTNSGSTDNNSADITLTVDASYAGGTTVQIVVNTGSLASVVTSGSAQSTVYFGNATNSNQKIFWISAVDDVSSPKTITVTVAPTGLTAGVSTGTIGGRFVLTPASLEAALRAGDTVIFNNSPATSTATLITARASGDTTSGYIRWMGKTGVRPLLNTTNTSAVVACSTQSNLWFENLEFDEDGATGACFTASTGSNIVLVNCKISDAGSGHAITAGSSVKLFGCEITGSAGDGINASAGNVIAVGCYIHDNTGDGIEYTGNTPTVILNSCIFDTNGGRGVLFSGAPTTQAHTIVISNCTFYANGNSGLETGDADYVVWLINNIFDSNGDAAGEYNVEWTAGVAENVSLHGYNVFYQGGGSAGNLLNMTAGAQFSGTEPTTNPSMTNPASADFSISLSSNAAATAYPGQLLGTNLGYLDMGAVQLQASQSSGPVGQQSM